MVLCWNPLKPDVGATKKNISDVFVQDCGNSSALALELPQSFTKLLISVAYDGYRFVLTLI